MSPTALFQLLVYRRHLELSSSSGLRFNAKFYKFALSRDIRESRSRGVELIAKQTRPQVGIELALRKLHHETAKREMCSTFDNTSAASMAGRPYRYVLGAARQTPVQRMSFGRAKSALAKHSLGGSARTRQAAKRGSGRVERDEPKMRTRMCSTDSRSNANHRSIALSGQAAKSISRCATRRARSI